MRSKLKTRQLLTQALPEGLVDTPAPVTASVNVSQTAAMSARATIEAGAIK